MWWSVLLLLFPRNLLLLFTKIAQVDTFLIYIYRSCNVKKIFVLVRPKKEKTAEMRLAQLIDDPVSKIYFLYLNLRVNQLGTGMMKYLLNLSILKYSNILVNLTWVNRKTRFVYDTPPKIRNTKKNTGFLVTRERECECSLNFNKERKVKKFLN